MKTKSVYDKLQFVTLRTFRTMADTVICCELRQHLQEQDQGVDISPYISVLVNWTKTEVKKQKLPQDCLGARHCFSVLRFNIIARSTTAFFTARRYASARYLLSAGGRLSVTLVNAEWLNILSSPFVSLVAPSFLVSWCHLVLPNSKGISLIGGVKYTGYENFAIFDWNWRLSRKRYEIGPWNANRKS